MASASAADDRIAWYANDGDGGFTVQPDISATADGASAVIAADLDGDGDLDVASASANDDRIAWYRNDGDGTFTAQPDVSGTADGASSVTAADLDRDGDLDLVSASSLDSRIAWYRNDGSGTFTTQPDISDTAAGASSVIAADVDRDGDLDVVSASTFDDTIALFRNDGNGNFVERSGVASSANGATSVIAADLDDDGDLDLASSSLFDNTIAWYRKDGTGAFTTLPDISTSAASARSVIAADLDRDGHVDLASASAGDNTIAWYRNAESQDPTVDAGGPYTVMAGGTVGLSAVGGDPNGGELGYAWDLDGDGEFDDATGSAPDYDSTVHGVPGENTVTVQVTDNENATATATAMVTITTPPAVDAGGPYTVVAGSTVGLTAVGEDLDGGEVGFAWDLDGDGEFDDATTAAVDFDAAVHGAPGENTVTVQVTDDENDTATDTAIVTITAAPAPPTPPVPPVPPTPPIDPVAVSNASQTDDPVQAAIDLSVLRFTGNDGFTQQQRSAQSVVLARVDVFADALGGSVLTGDSPLLYTGGDTLDPRTAAEIDRILATDGTVYLLGGTAALSDAIQTEVTDAGYAAVRLAGPSRVETAVAIADVAVNADGVLTQVGIARADAPADNPTAAWADAITAGGWAADTGSPILLTQTAGLHPAVVTWLADHPGFDVTALGGSVALADATVAAAGGTRITGMNRYDTAGQIADTLWPAEPDGYLIANGTATDAWAFTLAAAGVAADLDQPTLLVDADRLPPETDAQLCQTMRRADTTTIGSDRLITQAVRDQLTNACPA